MEFKYFKITEEKALGDIESAIQSIEIRDLAVKNLAAELNATDCLQFGDGDIAAFKFNSTPNKQVWKKAKHGFLPKVNTSEHKMMSELPKILDYRDIIKQYGFGGEMILGERTSNGTGIRMHSSYLKGNRKSNFYAIVVPYSGKFDKEVHTSLKELKEWEVTRGCDSSE